MNSHTALYGHELIGLNPLELGRTKHFLDNELRYLPTTVKKSLTRVYAKRNNSSTAKDPHRSANIFIRGKSKALNAVRHSPFFESVKLVYGRNPVYVQDGFKAYSLHHSVNVNERVSQIIPDSGEATEEVKLAYQVAAEYVESKGLKPPAFQESNPIPAILKMMCEKWWSRKAATTHAWQLEVMELIAGNVQARVSPYISKPALENDQAQQQQNLDYLEMMELHSDTGDIVGLAEMFNLSSASPEKRRIEMMVRARGLEERAIELDYCAEFITITCPSKFHPTSKKWNGSSPKQAQQYLCSVWAKIRSQLCEKDIEYFGVRVVEPHHDSCPHWHILLFVEKGAKKELINTCRTYALAEDSTETGAQKHRFTVESIDPAKGSAVGYLAKYISKNLNGSHMENQIDTELESEGENRSVKDSSARVGAWARLWRIRQFQFFGAASVTVYRELRRIKENVPEQFKALFDAADVGDWCKFQKLAAQQRVELYREQGELNRYAEVKKTVKGLVAGSVVLVTRVKSWVLKKRGSADAWTRVSNCQEAIKRQFSAPLERVQRSINNGFGVRGAQTLGLIEYRQHLTSLER